MSLDQHSSSRVRVLLLAPNWLGDAVMFTPLVDFLHRRRNLPDGRTLSLSLGVRGNWAPLFQDDPRFDFLVEVERGGRHGGLMGGWNLGWDLRKASPQAVVLGPPSFRFALAAVLSGAAVRVGYNSDGRGWMLSRGLAVPPRGETHHGRELLELGRILLNALGVSRVTVPGDLPMPSLPGCAAIAPEATARNRPYWILAPGATYGSAKSWPLARSTQFARAVLSRKSVRLVLLGDKAAGAFAQELAENLEIPAALNMDDDGPLVDLTGRTDLTAVVSLLKGSRLFVGNDSGLMHLSGALGCRTVGIFGSSNPLWTRPLGPRTAVAVPEGFACRPCYLKACNQQEFCLDTIEADDVLALADSLLEME